MAHILWGALGVQVGPRALGFRLQGSRASGLGFGAWGLGLRV